MRELPAGTVTMLFTDIEGSTALLSRLGDRYGEALSAHRAVLRAAFAAWGGREISTEGDSFFVVFESAGDAVDCCAAAQRTLGGYEWPGGATVRVRMGLHSGEPVRHEDNYVGMDVHRAARIAAAAHGGQVVLSEATRLLAGCAAARLFAQQAGMVRPGFAVTAGNAADIAAICRRLDGLPLAIELAASRIKLLTPRALLARLGHSLDLAAAEAGRPLRQQTMRNIVAWSHDLLAPDLARDQGDRGPRRRAAPRHAPDDPRLRDGTPGAGS